MTLIAGVVDKDTREVHMLADTFSSDSTARYASIKLVRRRLLTPNGRDSAGSVVIGYAGEHSCAYTARNATLPTIAKTADPWSVVDGIAHALQKFGQETPGGINFHGGSEQVWMVAWNGHLWSFVHYDITEAADCIAIGSGGDIALGALTALRELDPKRRLHEAAEITASLASSVWAPFRYEIVRPA